MNTILIPFQVVGLVCGPESELIRTSIDPGKETFSGDVIQTNPCSITIVEMLYENVFLLAVNTDQVCPHTTALSACVGPRFTCITDEVAGTVEKAPAILTHVYEPYRCRKVVLEEQLQA